MPMTEADTCRKFVVPLGALLKFARDIMRKDKGLNGDLDRLPMTRSAGVLACELDHRPGGSSPKNPNLPEDDVRR